MHKTNVAIASLSNLYYRHKRIVSSFLIIIIITNRRYDVSSANNTHSVNNSEVYADAGLPVLHMFLLSILCRDRYAIEVNRTNTPYGNCCLNTISGSHPTVCIQISGAYSFDNASRRFRESHSCM